MRANGLLATGLLTMASLAQAGFANGEIPLRVVTVASGLSRPVYVTSPPGDSTRIFILEQHSGNIKIVKDGVLLPTPFMQQTGVATGLEQGLLGLVFHPSYATNGYFYIHYTRAPGGEIIIKRYKVSANPDIADTTAGLTLMTVPNYSPSHNGGWLAFGPDGYLYIALGDDVDNDNAQSDTTRLGKILRINVNSGSPYSIPPSNPFFGSPSPRNEFWATGLRNPWRCSFDRQTGDLYVADVGQDLWEEVEFHPAGAPGGRNYGWPKFEAFAKYICPDPCDSSGLTWPIHYYSHGGNPPRCSIVGGYVYRGSAAPVYRGTYFFGDYCSEQIWTFRVVGGVATDFVDRTADILDGLSIQLISSFGEDARGELYICEIGGHVFKIVPETLADVGEAIPGGGVTLIASPNPSAAGFSLRFQLCAAESPRLRIFTTAGRLIRSLDLADPVAGWTVSSWDGRDAMGTLVGSGVYVVRLDSDHVIAHTKLHLIH